MKKIKLLLATALLLCSAGAWADDVFKNVTSTYLTNADFEGEYTVYSNPSSDRAIYQPNGWTVSYTNGDPNDMTALNSDCLQWSNFSGKAQLATGGNKTYWIRLRWGTGAILELSQTVTLPEGSYKLSADYYKNGTGGDGYILVNSTEKNASANEDVWKSLSIDFTSDGVAATKIGCKAKHTAEYEKFLAFDNFVLEWNLTKALTSLIASATEAYNEDTSNTTLKSAIDAANDVKDSQDADELETAYNNLKSVAALALNRKAWKEAKDAAESAYDDGDYANITGAEKVALKAEIDKAEPSNAEGYETAKNALIAATSAFTAAKDSYDAYVTAKAAATDVNEADVLAVVIAGNTAATAADALAASVILPKAQTNKDATAAAPVVTDFVVNGTFDSNITGWSRSGDYFQNNQRQTGKPAPFDGGFYENWTPTASNMLNKMYQTISNIPNGTYRLDIAAFVNNLASPNESQYVFANSDKTYLTTGDPTAYEVWTVVTNNSVEIGLEQTTSTANWMAIDNVSLRYYGAGDVVDAAKLANHKLAWDEAKAAAEAAIADAAYANVTGSEKTALQTEIDKAEPTTADGYDAAAEALISATSAFTAAKSSYDALVTEIAYAKTLGVTTTTAEDALNSSATAASVTAAAETLKTNEYTSVTNAYPNDVTTSLLGTWVTGNYGTTSGQGYSSDETYYDKWNGSAMDLSSSKTVSLPEGSYVVRVAGRGVSSTTMNLSVKVGDAEAISTPFLMTGDTGKGIDTSGATNFSNEGTYSNNNDGRGWQYRYIKFTTDGTGDVVITINGHLEGNTWQSFYAPVLLCDNTTAGSIYAGTTEYSALNDAISDAEAKTLGFEDGQYAPYNNVAAIEALAAAKAIVQTAELTNFKTDVEDATTALTNATWTANTADLDAIYNGNFAETGTGNNPKGWTRSNNGWGQQITGLSAATNGVAEGTTTAWYYNNNGAWQYGNDGVYTMPLAAGQTYELSFKYSKHGSDWQNWMKASVLKDDAGLALTEFSAADNGTDYVTAKAYFTTGAAGNYILSIEQYGNAHLTDVSLVKAADATLALSDASDYTPIDRVYYEQVNLTRTIKVGYNTVVLPFDLTADKVKAAYGTDCVVYNYSETSADANSVDLTFTAGDGSITANTPVLVKVVEGQGSNLQPFNDVVFKAAADGAKVTGTNFDYVGVYDNTTMANGDYFLATKNDVQQIFKSNGTDTVKPFRAYFKAKSAGVKAMLFIVDEATSIDAINGMEAENGVIYNLAGQRLNKVQKGINIINGRKVLY